jgi:two-component system phosphate regulon sensor histidine kinase PhoR
LSKSLRARIDAILLYNEMRSGAKRQEAEEQSSLLPNIMDAALLEVSDRAAERHVTILSSIPKISVNGNEHQLVVLFANLIANAVAYSLTGQSVTVAVSFDGSEAQVSVQDNGIGIRENALPFIFDEYYRTKEAASLNHSSTGLGLAIVKEIAEHLALTIRVESEEGTGTTFTVRLKQIRSTQDAKDHDSRR